MKQRVNLDGMHQMILLRKRCSRYQVPRTISMLPETQRKYLQRLVRCARVTCLLNITGVDDRLAGERFVLVVTIVFKYRLNLNPFIAPSLGVLYRFQSNITRSKAEAMDILRQYTKEINGSPTKFGELAAKYSDCSSHTKNGDLGWFGPGQMQRPFEEGTTALKIGQISDIVETDSGVHLILRTG